jgi:hypothetical protein
MGRIDLWRGMGFDEEVGDRVVIWGSRRGDETAGLVEESEGEREMDDGEREGRSQPGLQIVKRKDSREPIDDASVRRDKRSLETAGGIQQLVLGLSCYRRRFQLHHWRTRDPDLVNYISQEFCGRRAPSQKSSSDSSVLDRNGRRMSCIWTSRGIITHSHRRWQDGPRRS